jgi:hypothetical protein
VYDFVTNPENWTKTYPGSARINKLPELPLKVGDTWDEAGPDGDRIFSWQLAAAVRPSYRFTRPGQAITPFSRTVTIEARKDAPLPDQLFQQANPATIDAYHEAVARELAAAAD